MGGTILWRASRRRFTPVTLVAPMFGIALPMPSFLTHRILDRAEKRPAIRDGYALGTGRWRAHPFGINRLTHSAERYRRSLRFHADDPAILVGGPTYHWVREGIHAGRSILSLASTITTPILLLQAGDSLGGQPFAGSLLRGNGAGGSSVRGADDQRGAP
ncbi:serine aminopeptidase domain-containing protein [Candidatus Pantoea persica]|uniref:serine aminopeptidase domain-containing protein n=1 Tax=Candidatus Pantoea persica TaxID=2518128 RepID=UPI0035A9140D|nr:lysophospholipase L3 [Candidatus Pantoea persica]